MGLAEEQEGQSVLPAPHVDHVKGVSSIHEYLCVKQLLLEFTDRPNQ